QPRPQRAVSVEDMGAEVGGEGGGRGAGPAPEHAVGLEETHGDAPLAAADGGHQAADAAADDGDVVHAPERPRASAGFREPFVGFATPGDVEELVRRAQRGDTTALNALLSELAPYVGRICGAVAIGGAEDATQEALVAIFKNLPSLREPLAL